MKTKSILAAIIIMVAVISAQASPSARTLTFRDALGKVLEMPVKVEEAVSEDLPFDQKEIFSEIMNERASQIFDISDLSEPERDADDIPASLKEVIGQMMN